MMDTRAVEYQRDYCVEACGPSLGVAAKMRSMCDAFAAPERSKCPISMVFDPKSH